MLIAFAGQSIAIGMLFIQGSKTMELAWIWIEHTFAQLYMQAIKVETYMSLTPQLMNLTFLYMY